MKTGKNILAAVLLLLCLTSTYGQTSYNFSQGLNAAKSSGKKVLVYIYSEQDNWCKKMDSEVFSSSNVKNALSGFIFVKLNADSKDKFSYNKKEYTSSELASYFGATGYPAFVLLNPDGSIIKFRYNGEEVTNLSGYIGVEDFPEMMDYFAKNSYKDTDLSTIFQN